MRRLLRLYLGAGTAFLLGVYVLLLSIWFEATLNGSVTGQFAATVDTNVLGEGPLVLALLFLFLPVVVWVFTRMLRGLLGPDDVPVTPEGR